MAVNLKGRSFLTLADFTPAEIRYLLDLARDLTLFLAEKFNLTDMLDGVAELGRKFTGFLGI